MIRVGSRYLSAQREAFMTAARGGMIHLVAGDRPANSDDQPAIGKTVVAFQIDGTTFTFDGPDAVVAMNIQETARAEGKITHFVVTTADREPLVDGDVGVKRDTRVIQDGDLYLNRLDLLPGDRVTLDELRIRFARTK